MTFNNNFDGLGLIADISTKHCGDERNRRLRKVKREISEQTTVNVRIISANDNELIALAA